MSLLPFYFFFPFLLNALLGWNFNNKMRIEVTLAVGDGTDKRRALVAWLRWGEGRTTRVSVMADLKLNSGLRCFGCSVQSYRFGDDYGFAWLVLVSDLCSRPVRWGNEASSSTVRTGSVRAPAGFLLMVLRWCSEQRDRVGMVGLIVRRCGGRRWCEIRTLRLQGKTVGCF